MRLAQRLWMASGVAVAAVAAVAAVGSAGASATPGEGVDAVTLSESSVDGKSYVARMITIAPGGTTGWHYHPGDVFAVVRAGTLTHYAAASCAVDGVYGAGAPISEASGPGYVHVGRNEGAEPLVMWVLYANPPATPLAIDVPDPGCPLPGAG
ncbi:cupin domain-containing protein [Mycolicibacterium vanbaalenii]|nr:cupin [Mycolicibacterium vanbaalenii]